MIHAVVSHRPPAMRVSRNPLEAPAPMQVVRVGATIASLKPEATGLLVCVVNGSPLPRLTARQRQTWVRKCAVDAIDGQKYLAKAARRELNWKTYRVRPGDVIEWHDQPQEKQIAQIIIVIAAVIYGYYTGDWSTAFKFATYALAAVNFLLPPTVPDRNQEEQGKDLFSTSLNGNQARLDQPIWRNFGRVKITPPFAAYPYYEYQDLDGDNLDNDQFYYAVFAVGIGDHELESALIGRTPIGHFQDIQTATYLPPGTQPSIARCNVVSSTEVSTALELDSGRYVGGYAACQPRRRAGAVGVDVMCPQGLGKNGDPLTVSFQIEARDINEFGVAVTSWYVIGNESHTASTNTPQRWSHKYAVGSIESTNPTTGDFEIVYGTGRRVEIRVIRTDLKDTDSAARHALQWIGLRAYLDEPAPLDADTAHFEVVMRASEQLSSNSQRDFSLIVWPLVRTWSPASLGSPSGWSAPMRTRNPAWALADLWTNPIWGEGLPDSRVDLQGLYEWSLKNDTRQDRFDFSFSTNLSAWDAGQMIARAGRARVFRRYGVKTLARDELQELPMTALTPANTIADSMTINEKLPNRESPDGIVAQYTSNITWDDAFIECPAPGFTVTDPLDLRYDADLPSMSNPVYKQYAGVTGAKHAEREGLYDAADMVLRNRTVTCTTEMMGVVTSYMMPVLFQPDVAGYGQSGDVAFWDADTLVMGLTEKPEFGISGATFLTLVRDDGSVTDPVLVTPGPTEWDITLPAAPDFDLVLDDGTRMRPKFVLGDMDLLVKISGISDAGTSDAPDGEQGSQLYGITAVVDDDRVHLADVHLLPGPGEIQDPVDPGVPVDGDDFYGIVTLRDHRIQAGQGVGGGGYSASFTLFNDGTAQGHVEEGGPSSVDFPYSGEWLLVPVEVAQATQYEVYASINPFFASAFSGSALNTWLS
ncbi:MAG TPA: host specificity factor TipJ family phage tail protein, partial [Burkholderiaceae bacterium]|nr:host specificity factor TipJ family phage tail protein [Burkholderiaceae bacterium]